MDVNKRIEIVRRVPIFQRFSEAQMQKTLEVCEEHHFKAGQQIFREGDPSTEMFIILSGFFRVLSLTGSEIALIGEMGLVGEMGVLTDQPRSATVVAYHDVEALCMGRDRLKELMKQDKDMGYKIYQNVTQILCDRLRDNNILLEQQYLILEDLASED